MVFGSPAATRLMSVGISKDLARKTAKALAARRLMSSFWVAVKGVELN